MCYAFCLDIRFHSIDILFLKLGSPLGSYSTFLSNLLLLCISFQFLSTLERVVLGKRLFLCPQKFFHKSYTHPSLRHSLVMLNNFLISGLTKRSTVICFYHRCREITSHAELSFQEQLVKMSLVVSYIIHLQFQFCKSAEISEALVYRK